MRIPITVGSIVKAILKTHGTVVGEVTALNGGRSVTIQTVDGRTVTDTIRYVHDDPLTLDEQIDLCRVLHGPPKVALYFRILRQVMADELDRYITHGIPHPHGTPAWLAERVDAITQQSGLGAAYVQKIQATCPMCQGPGPWRSCAICTLGRCAACAITHDAARSIRGDHSVCSLTARAAEVHAQMRQHFLNGSDEPVLPEAEDFHFARQVMASSTGPGK